MSQDYKIKKLAEYLAEIGLDKEAARLLDLVAVASLSVNSVDAWYDVIVEIDSDYIDPGYKAVSGYMKNAAHYLEKAAPELQDITKEELKSILDNIPLEKFISQASDVRLLRKYAVADGQDPLIKAAGLLHELGYISAPEYKKAFLGLVGKAAGKIIPFGAFILAVINFYYCAVSIWKLMSELPDAGLRWYDCFVPSNIKSAAERNKENPEILKSLGKATKTSEVLYTEYISLLANLVDGIKDFVFLFIDVGSGGWSVAIDIGISVIILFIELGVNTWASSYYQDVLKAIRGISVDKIIDLKSTEIFSEDDLSVFEFEEAKDQVKEIKQELQNEQA